MKKYEYKTVSKTKGLEEELNTLGKEGWEVVAAANANVAGSTVHTTVILKREL